MLWRYELNCSDEGLCRFSAEPYEPSAHHGPGNPSAGNLRRRRGGQPLMVLPVEQFEPPLLHFRRLTDLLANLIPGLRVDCRQPEGELLELSWPAEAIPMEPVYRALLTAASPERYGRAACGYADLIGRTPLYRLDPLVWGNRAEILVKLESMEPGSVKDRTVLGMVSAAADRGEIDAGTAVVEASSGNVAFALAAVCQAKFRRKPTIFISDMHGPVKIGLIHKSGCRVCTTPADEGTAGAKQASVEYAAANGAWELNQHGNPDNPETHRRTTGPELYHQCMLLTGCEPAEFVTSIGSGGTAVGTAMYRDDIGARFKVIGVEPAEASLLTGGTFHPHAFSGTAPGFITDIVSRSRDLIDGIETVAREEGFAVCRRMLIEEGLLVGPSSGASIAAALRRAALPENEGKVIVTIAHDRGERYLAVEGLFEPPSGVALEPYRHSGRQ